MNNKHTHIGIHPKTIKIEPCFKNDIFLLVFLYFSSVFVTWFVSYIYWFVFYYCKCY